MKPLLSIAFCFAALFSFAQVTKIKVKKQEALYKVTLTGVDSGCASLKQIIKEKELIVSNPKDPVKVYSYMVYIDYNEGGRSGVAMQGSNAVLSEELIKLLSENTPDKLTIRKILAYNSFNESIQLNDIVITLMK